MITKPFKTTEIINLFMIDRLVLFFTRKQMQPTSDADQHEHYELYFVRRGKVTMRSGDATFSAEAGQCFLTPPNTAHHLVETEGETTLSLSGFICKGSLLLPLCGRVIDLTEDEQELLSEIAEEGTRCFELMPDQSHELGYQVRPGISRGRLQALKNKLEIFLIKMIESRLADQSPARRTTVADGVYTYLTAHVTDRVTLEQIAGALSLSVPYIKREFSKKYGRGIIDTFLDMKISRAKELIRETNLNFTQIADYLSFESGNHFSKTFKKRTGKTPREWSESNE